MDFVLLADDELDGTMEEPPELELSAEDTLEDVGLEAGAEELVGTGFEDEGMLEEV